MRKIIYLLLIGFIFCIGCKSLTEDETNISALFTKLNIQIKNDTTNLKIVIIPLEGCGKCIKQAVNDITNKPDYIYILSCFSKKSARMSVGDNILMYPNVYLDERSFAVKSSLVTVGPMFYLLKGNKCILKKKY